MNSNYESSLPAVSDDLKDFEREREREKKKKKCCFFFLFGNFFSGFCWARECIRLKIYTLAPSCLYHCSRRRSPVTRPYRLWTTSVARTPQAIIAIAMAMMPPIESDARK